MHFLATDAYYMRSGKKVRTSYETATGYDSSIKAYFQDKFRTHEPPLPLSYQPEHYKVLRDNMYKIFIQRCRKEGTFLVKPHVTSTVGDRRSLDLSAIWDKSSWAAEFWNINN